MLEEKGSELSPEHRRYIEQTLEFVDRTVEDEHDRHYRSRVYTVLDTRTWPELHVTVWNTIAHAWNSAVQLTLSPDGGSVPDLPASAPVGIYLDYPTDALVPFERKAGRKLAARIGRRPMVATFPWDPARLSWETIKVLVWETLETQHLCQRALHSADDREIAAALQQHVRALTSRIVAPPEDRLPGLVWLVATGALVAFGSPDILNYLTGAQLAYQAVLDLLKRLRSFQVANTLSKFARRMTPSPTPVRPAASSSTLRESVQSVEGSTERAYSRAGVTRVVGRDPGRFVGPVAVPLMGRRVGPVAVPVMRLDVGPVVRGADGAKATGWHRHTWSPPTPTFGAGVCYLAWGRGS